MREDMAAAYLDLDTTGQLRAAIQRAEAPPPSAMRGLNGRRIPIWLRSGMDDFIASRHNAMSSVHPPANDNDPNFNAAEFI
jgi:hypothetical protein